MARLFILLALALPLFAQNYKPTYQSNPNLNLDSVLAGVKVVKVASDEVWQREIDRGSRNEQVDVVKQYLNYLGFDSIAITSVEKNNLSKQFGSTCDAITFDYGYNWEEENGKTKLRLWIVFSTCQDDQFCFQVPLLIVPEYPLSPSGLANYMLQNWKQLYSRKLIYYNVKQRLTVSKTHTFWTKKTVIKYLDSANIDSVEGIYELMNSDNKFISESKYLIALIKKGIYAEYSDYILIYLSGASYNEDWDEGEIQGALKKTAVPGTFKVQWLMGDKSINKDVYMEHDPKGFLIFQIGTPPETNRYIKLYRIKW